MKRLYFAVGKQLGQLVSRVQQTQTPAGCSSKLTKPCRAWSNGEMSHIVCACLSCCSVVVVLCCRMVVVDSNRAMMGRAAPATAVKERKSTIITTFDGDNNNSPVTVRWGDRITGERLQESLVTACVSFFLSFFFSFCVCQLGDNTNICVHYWCELFN